VKYPVKKKWWLFVAIGFYCGLNTIAHAEQEDLFQLTIIARIATPHDEML